MFVARLPSPSQLRWESGTHRPSADETHCMELFGLGSALDCAIRRGAGAGSAVHLTEDEEYRRSHGCFEGGTQSVPRLHQAIMQEWRWGTVSERTWENGQQGRATIDSGIPVGAYRYGRPWGITLTDIPPTPSAILTASSLRMMLSMATAFRASNPVILQTICSTLLELLLEIPALALAPLHREPSSIEASTFGRVTVFCAELMRSPDPAEREPALGVYLALAVSRGEVSGLLEVVSCLLDRCRKARLGVRESVRVSGAVAGGSAADGSALSAGDAAVTGKEAFRENAEIKPGRGAKQKTGHFSAILERLEHHRVDLRLSCPPVRGGARLSIKVPARVVAGARSSSTDVPSDFARDGGDEGIEWDCPSSGATDGRFVYAWHPDIGLLKAGTGLGGTVKGRVYAENTGAGRVNADCALVVALPTAASQQGGSGVDVTERLSCRAAGKDFVQLTRAGDIFAGRTADQGGVSEGCGMRRRRLLVHYAWRGVHDIESFSEEHAVELPTARARRIFDFRQRKVDPTTGSGVVDGDDGEGALASGRLLRVISATCATFGGAMGAVAQLCGGHDATSLRMPPGYVSRLVEQYVVEDSTATFSSCRWRRREGFVAVIGGRVYLQAGGRMPPNRFLVARTSDLAVEGIADAEGLPWPPECLRGTETPQLGEGESKAEDAESEEKREATAAGPPQSCQECPVSRVVPLCSDGRLLYALLPMDGTGRPSVVAVDIADGGRVAKPAVELRHPHFAPIIRQRQGGGVGNENRRGEAGQPMANGDQESVRRTSRDSGAMGEGGGQYDPTTTVVDWIWWKSGGAVPGVRTYCNRDHFIVCWLGPAELADPDKASTLRNRVRRAEARLGTSSPQSGSGCGAASNIVRTTWMARFRLSTGAFESMENNTALSGNWWPSTPCLMYDPYSNIILRCALRRPLPLSSHGTEPSKAPVAAEFCISIWRNSGLTPGPLANGRYDWRGALRALAADEPSPSSDDEMENAQGCDDKTPLTSSAGDGQETPRLHQESVSGVPALTRVAVFVLAHLDRLGTHYVGRAGNMVSAEDFLGFGAEDPSPPFCHDVSPATFKHLVGLVEMYWGELSTRLLGEDGGRDGGVPEHLRWYILCASLRLLNVNVGILLSRGQGVAAFGGESLLHSLLPQLLDLIEGCGRDCTWETFQSRRYDQPDDGEAGRAVAAREALRLVVDGMDLFYPTQRRQGYLLCSYLRAYGANGGSLSQAAARAVTLELLARASSATFLRSVDTMDSGDGSPGAPAHEELLGPGLPLGGHLSLGCDALGTLSKTLIELSVVQSVRDVRSAAEEGAKGSGRSMESTKGSWRNDRSSGSGGQVGEAVLGALGAVLKFRCAEAFHAADRTAREPGDSEGRCPTAAVEVKSRPLLRLFLLVLRAADDVLGAVFETKPACVEAIALLPEVADALRCGLIGTLLPSCLASALALLDKIGQRGWNWSGTAGAENEALLEYLREPLVQVVRKLGVFLMTPNSNSTVQEGPCGSVRSGTPSGCERSVGADQVGKKRDLGKERGRGAGVSAAAEDHPEVGMVIFGSPEGVCCSTIIWR